MPLLSQSDIVSMMLRAMQFEPTASQYEAVKKLSALICSPDPHATLLIRGYAGTGKTTLMQAFCETASSLGFPLSLMAPTGRAAKVLSGISKRPAHTIHRTIYRQMSNDINSRFELGYNNGRQTIYIVDEASMISDTFTGETEFGSGRLLTDLISFVYSRTGCKLLLIGDPAQLPPIGLNEAPALNDDKLRGFGLSVDSVWLTDIVRQEQESAILTNADSLRRIIDNEPDFCGYPRLTATPGSDVERLSGAELIETLITCHDRYGTENTLVVTRSNKRATRFNQGIRSTVLFKEEEITRGDLLMVGKNNYLWLAGENDDDFIANGDIAEVVRVSGYNEMYGLRFANASLKFLEHNDIDVDAKILLNCLNSETPRLSHDEERQFLDMVLQDYADIHDRRKLAEAVRNDKWFNALQVKFAYAVTCHKAQGGQWDAVFVDTGYVAPEQMTTEFLKWLYTAFTRATKKLYLVNFADEYFG